MLSHATRSRWVEINQYILNYPHMHTLIIGCRFILEHRGALRSIDQHYCSQAPTRRQLALVEQMGKGAHDYLGAGGALKASR